MTFQDWAAVVGVSSIVSAAVSAAFGLLRDTAFLQVQFKHDQRKQLRNLIGEYHGRVLEAALDWDRRMRQLYDRAAQDDDNARWHELSPGPTRMFAADQYVYQSLVFRFLSLMALARRFEAEAFYIQCEVAKETDFDFLRYMKGFLWAAIHPEITPYDGVPGLDHFRSDSFRPVLDYCYARREGLPLTLSRGEQLIFDWERFHAIVAQLKLTDPEQARVNSVSRAFVDVSDFFDGLCSHDDKVTDSDGTERERRRWDRLVVLHLFVLAFLARFGYTWQRSDLAKKSDEAVRQLRYGPELLPHLKAGLANLGFGTEEKPFWSRSAQNGITVISSALEKGVSAAARSELDKTPSAGK